MRIKNLELKNIGPFKEANLDFIGENTIEKPPVTIITGENGTGKTIILDAIRALMFGPCDTLKRDILQDKNNFILNGHFAVATQNEFLDLYIIAKGKANNDAGFLTNQMQFNEKFNPYLGKNKGNDYWVTNYWTSKTSDEKFSISNLTTLEPEKYLENALTGVQPNVEVLKLICSFDYLRSSESPKEKEEGDFLFNIIKKIIKLSLIDGEFRYVERKTLMPIVYQTGSEVSLDKLSSGNLYLIQRLISLLGQMYSVYVLNNLSLSELCNTSGLLLIDEAENHLHPKWQKTFINSILDIFPNLQIIITTHSPFIISSVENARIYVCESKQDYSVVTDATAEYSNKPIEEILLSPVFDTNTFNTTITKLMEERKKAIEIHDFTKVDDLEKQLKAINPEYFSYFDVEQLLASLENH